jgi:hypothetical protein
MFFEGQFCGEPAWYGRRTSDSCCIKKIGLSKERNTTYILAVSLLILLEMEQNGIHSKFLGHASIKTTTILLVFKMATDSQVH